jgi:ATP-dependent Clp protease ATP-binding subunit ClpA
MFALVWEFPGGKVFQRAIASLLAFVCVLFFQVTYAENFSLKNVPKVTTSEELRKMSLEELDALHARLAPLWSEARKISSRSEGGEVETDAIKDLENYQLQEHLQIGFALFRGELKRLETKKGASKNVCTIALSIIGKLATSTPHRFIEELFDIRDEIEKRIIDPAFQAKALGTIDEFLVKVKDKNLRLENLDDLIRNSAGSNRSVITNLQRIEDFLKKKIKGQPEVIEAFMDIEWHFEFLGQQEAPDLIYFLGPPGTGKDTSAEALVDAIHGFEGAHKQHMFRVPVMKKEADLWRVFGSGVGYIGSENFPPILEFLVSHSGGKYKLETFASGTGKTLTKVVKNPEYREGEVLPGYTIPQRGVIFINEFHNWSKVLKDAALKESIEKGRWPIHNPNGGLSEIDIPIRFIFASNEGEKLLASRELNGQRHGDPLTFKETDRKWELIHNNKAALKDEIASGNGQANNPVVGESAPGISQELLNRIPDQYLILFRPLSPEALKEIAAEEFGRLKKLLNKKSRLFDSVNLNWDQSTIDLIQSYDYNAEENARPIGRRIKSMILKPLLDAVREGKIKADGKQIDITLNIKDNEDKTRTLQINVKDAAGETYVVEQLIKLTIKDRPREPISDERIDELSNAEEQMNQRVFGIETVSERLSERLLSIENEINSKVPRRPHVIGLFGPSSVGKTETAKAITKIRTGDSKNLIVLDFSQIQTLHQFQSRILGLRDTSGNLIPSDFMKELKRNNGQVVVAFDELANVKDPDLLKVLYDFFREPRFNGEAMGGVLVIVTGNAGQEFYKNIPRNIPMEVQMEGWRTVAETVAADPEAQRSSLERVFPEPLITRFGKNNIFFIPPHTYRSLRQLTQLKLKEALEALSKTEGRRGWDIQFPEIKDYQAFLDTVIREGFSLRYQGASIDSFIADDFQEPIKSVLLRNKVPSGKTVVMRERERTEALAMDKPGYVFYDLFVDGYTKPLEYKIRRTQVERKTERNIVKQLLTVAHEDGHELVSKALFPEIYESKRVTVIPGVTMIGDEWIYYAGLAQREQAKEAYQNRDFVVRNIAVLAAGELSERLISKGQTHSKGKVNDMERASAIAQDAILRFGLSPGWGTRSIPTGMTIVEYVAGLPEAQKARLDKEVGILIEEGRDLAQRTLEANYDNAFIPLFLLLGEKGDLGPEDLENFYSNHPVHPPKAKGFISSLKRSFANWKEKGKESVIPELRQDVPVPPKIADIDEIVGKRKQEQFDSVALPDQLPIGTNSAYREKAGTQDCGELLLLTHQEQ